MIKIKTKLDGESIAEEFNREKRSFLENNVPVVYTDVSGNIYLFPDYSGFVSIKGRFKETQKAIKEGLLEGMIWEGIHPECFIIPQLTQNGHGLEVMNIFEGTSYSLYDSLNQTEKKAELRKYNRQEA
jgi:hypothetical protein